MGADSKFIAAFTSLVDICKAYYFCTAGHRSLFSAAASY
jgi:hypothetical protein